MPYIITTKEERSTARTASGRELELHEGRRFKGWSILSRRAVATLDEAQTEAANTIRRDFNVLTPDSQHYNADAAEACRAALALPEQGGSIGPLPNGTVIEIERVEYRQLRRTLGDGPHWLEPDPDSAAIDAYNAAQ